MILDKLPVDVQPIIQPIDDWNECRKLGLLFEAKIGRGKLLVCSVDLTNKLEKRPVVRQLRNSLINYMNSTEFDPAVMVNAETVKNLLISEEEMIKRKFVVHADNEHPSSPAKNVLDNSTATIWHTSWDENATDYPHKLEFDLNVGIELSGFRMLPRQDGNRNGWIKDVKIEMSNDGIKWETLVPRHTLSNNQEWKVIELSEKVKARYIRVTALSPWDKKSPWASLAEFSFLFD